MNLNIIHEILKKNKDYKYNRITAILGFFCALFFISFMCLSILNSSGFSFTKHYLSELAGGVGNTPIWTAYGLQSLFFNFGLILTGFIGILFAIFLKKDKIFISNFGKIGIIALFLSMIFLILAGVFPITVGSFHLFFSALFFSLIPSVTILLGYEIGRLFGKKYFYIISFISINTLLISASLMLFEDFLGRNKAISEIIMFFTLFFVIVIISYKLVFFSPLRKINRVK